MIIINRFLQIADRFDTGKIKLDQVFGDARADEIDHVLKALYVIADRRMDSGDPVQLEEIAEAIPELIEDEAVLEAAVEISIDGLVATGHGQQQRIQDLESQLRALARSHTDNRNRAPQSVSRHEAEVAAGYRGVLPRDFGPKDLDDRLRYELRRVLGSGNQGITYEALDRLFSEEFEPVFVAVKVFHETSEHSTPQAEGFFAKKVRHPNVASVIDHGRSEHGDQFVVYELVQGMPLDDWVKRKPSLPQREMLRIVIKIAEGVQAMHASGVVHRDLKPGNIMITNSGDPVITDFGIAQLHNQFVSESGRYGTRGSLAFMAPEQYKGSAHTVPLIDLYALGGILYWLIVGRFPNGDRVVDAIDWLEEHETGGPARDDLSVSQHTLRAVIIKSLSLDPESRYQSAAAFSHDLSCILRSVPVDGVRESPARRFRLYVIRNKYLVSAYASLLLLVAVGVANVVRGSAAKEFEKASAAHAIRVQQLNHDIELESLRADQLTQRMVMAREMVSSWVETLNAEEGESAVLFNLLFLHSQSLNGPLASDPKFLSDLLERRVDIAIEYAESLDPKATSPIELAMWYEMIAGWLEEAQPQRSLMYSERAVRLVEEYAPDDMVWRQKLLAREGS